MEESEFGKGLVICLVKFSEHLERWHKTQSDYKEMSEKRPGLFNESHAVVMYFNAASDHLYEIEVPKKWEGTKIEKKVLELKELGLRIGHGFKDEVYTHEDVNKAWDLCREIALLIDKKLGLKPQLGKW